MSYIDFIIGQTLDHGRRLETNARARAFDRSGMQCASMLIHAHWQRIFNTSQRPPYLRISSKPP
jgi:hypothetical protein